MQLATVKDDRCYTSVCLLCSQLAFNSCALHARGGLRPSLGYHCVAAISPCMLIYVWWNRKYFMVPSHVSFRSAFQYHYGVEYIQNRIHTPSKNFKRIKIYYDLSSKVYFQLLLHIKTKIVTAELFTNFVAHA